LILGIGFSKIEFGTKFLVLFVLGTITIRIGTRTKIKKGEKTN
jgi:hypothetical protein